ncbi:MAG: response regulator transcription factor [Armatimonadota bacterium]
MTVEPEQANPRDVIRILLVDDHPIVREGLAAIIERRPDMTVVAEAGNGRDAVTAFRMHCPDVTLMDLRLPEMDGVSAIEAIHVEFPYARFLVLTTFDGDEDIYRALRAGARGYVLKGTPRDELLAAVRAVHAGQRWLPPEVAAKLGERIATQDLTARERDVLRLIAAGKSNQEIGAALFITEGTVKGHVNTLLAKLDARDRTQAVTTALRRGILHLG